MSCFSLVKIQPWSIIMAGVAAFVTPACDDGPEDVDELLLEEREGIEEDVLSLDEPEEASPGIVADVLDNGEMPEPVPLKSGWTAWTSEETPPVVCDPGSVVTGFGCSGGNCDNVRLNCSPAGVGAYFTFWSNYFSEEGNNMYVCPIGSWMTGITCQGSRCDNISIQCTSTQPPNAWPPKYPPSCQWSGWVSEENGGTLWLDYYGHVRGVQCSGGMCDNKRFYLCNT